MLHPNDFFDLKPFDHKDLFTRTTYVWEALVNLKSYIEKRIQPNVQVMTGIPLTKTVVLWRNKVITEKLKIEPGDATKDTVRVIQGDRVLNGATVVYAGAVLFDDNIAIGQGTVVEPGALIKGPTIIGNHTEIRQGAYIRGNCLIGDKCVVGHTTEMKTAVMLDDAKAGHFAYIGDSILGNHVNLGAGTKLANLKIIKADVKLTMEGKTYPTGLKKMGAILGDHVEIGCNAVSSPGTLLGKASLVYPNVNIPGGIYPGRNIISMNAKKILSIRMMRSRRTSD